MRLVRFTSDAHPTPHVGVLLPALESRDEEVLDLERTRGEGMSGPLGWFDLTGAGPGEAEDLAADVGSSVERRIDLAARGALLPLGEVRLEAPIPRPGKVLCIGLNYKDHAEESGMDLPERPLLFSKFPSCVVGPGADVRMPEGSEQVDYEAELGIVIGRTATRVEPGHGREHILGYVCVNDVSARDFQFADGQWQRGKSCDTFCPVGPWVATKSSIPEPETLRIQFRLDGRTLQDSNTDQLVFGVAALVETLSRTITLEPGDLICTGTPPGVGFARKPPVYVQAGQSMEVEIEGLGVLVNPTVA